MDQAKIRVEYYIKGQFWSIIENNRNRGMGKYFR